MKSEEKVAQAVENSAKRVAANVENEKSTTADDDFQLDMPPAEARFFTKPTYKLQIEVGLTKT